MILAYDVIGIGIFYAFEEAAPILSRIYPKLLFDFYLFPPRFNGEYFE